MECVMSSRMSKWYNFDFENCQTNETGYDRKAFNKFGLDFKKEINTLLEDIGAEVHSISRGYFILSGFIKKDDKLVYFSIDDVRFNKFQKDTMILVRTAKHDRDFTGGRNNFSNLDNLKKDVQEDGLAKPAKQDKQPSKHDFNSSKLKSVLFDGLTNAAQEATRIGI